MTKLKTGDRVIVVKGLREGVIGYIHSDILGYPENYCWVKPDTGNSVAVLLKELILQPADGTIPKRWQAKSSGRLRSGC